MADTSFTATLSVYVANQTANPVDATGASFGGVAASSATVTQQFGIVDKIIDGVDVPGIGLVRTNATQVYVTPNSFFYAPTTTAASIQRGINVANPGDIVNVAAGTYTDNLTFNGPLTVIGAGDGTNPATSTIITAAVTTSPVATVNGGRNRMRPTV